MSWFGADFPGESRWFGFEAGQDNVKGVEQLIVAGGAAGALVITPRSAGASRPATGSSLGADVHPNDLLISVIGFNPAGPSLVDLTDEFSITDVNEISNPLGTNTTSWMLLVTVARVASQKVGA